MTQAQAVRIETILKIVALAFGVATTSGFVVVKLLDLETKSDHEADVLLLHRKLDCAIWQLPRNCRDLLSPRGE